MLDAAYRMPAEWETHRATWLIWPHQRADWPGKFGPVEWAYAEIVRYVAKSEKVGLIVKNAKVQARVSIMFEESGTDLANIEFVHAATNRAWTRDSGPIFVEKRRDSCDPVGVALDWKFNGWAKYSNSRLDDALPEIIAAYRHIERAQPFYLKDGKKRRVVLEGGGIDVNGSGAILTTEEWLLSDSQVRNRGFTREDYEALFAEWLGAPHTIWLGHGIVGDDTHGHVDDLARFTAADTIAIATERKRDDANYDLLHDNQQRLKKARDGNGKPFNIIELPMPTPVVFQGQRLPASYANFLITNTFVLVPSFNDTEDRLALNLLAEAFPTRQVVGIHCLDLVWGLGTIHCLSQQEPLLQ